MVAGRRSWLVAMAVLGAAQLAEAQDQPDPGVIRPELAQRIVRIFDFEERLLHPLDIPRHWSRAQGITVLPGSSDVDPRPGFPPFNQAELDYTTAYRGEGSVRLPVMTGSTSLRLNPGVLPIFSSADYQVSARVMTRGLVGARACLAARFLDREGKPITASENRSDAIISEGTWSLVRVVMPGEYPEAVSLQIDLEVLQPTARAGWATAISRSGAAAARDDINGAAWFDDVAIVQLPRIEFSTTRTTNIILAPEAPTLRLSVRDLTGERLAATVIVQDSSGLEVATHTRAIGLGESTVELRPDLPGFGWYRAALRVTNDRVVVATAYVDFLYLATDSREPPDVAVSGDTRNLTHVQDADRFGLILTEVPRGQETVLPDLIVALGQRWVMLPIWTSSITPQSAAKEVNRLSPALERLGRLWRDVVLCLDRVPDDLARRLAGTTRSLFESTSAAPDDLAALLDPFLDKFGQSVGQWQIGRFDDASAFWEPRLDERLEAFERTISRLAPGPLLGLSWRVDHAPTGAMHRARRTVDAVTLHVPADVAPSSIPEYLSAWFDPGATSVASARPSITIAIETLQDDLFGRRAAADDLVKRMIHVWESLQAMESTHGMQTRIGLAHPWEWTGQRRAQTMPSAPLAAWHVAARHLVGRRIAQRIEVSPGVRCFVLSPAQDVPPSRGSALVAWAEGPADEPPVLDLFLGLDPITVHDVFGNARPVPMSRGGDEAGEPPMYHVEVTNSPIFIEGVDAELIAFLASLRVEPAFLRSRELDHEVVLSFRNAWPTALSGRASIISPGGVARDGTLDRSWSIVPRSLDIYTAPGESQAIPFRIGFSAANEAGIHRLVMDLDLASTRPYRRIRTSIPFEIGVEHMRAEVTHRFAGANPPYDVIVEARIINLGNEPLTLEVAGFAPGFRRQAASIGTLQPGQTATRHLIFPAASTSLRGQSIAVRVEDLETHARITKAIVVE